MKPAIVLPVFSRPASLERLLGSLSAAGLPNGTPLLISVDRAADDRHRSGNATVLEIARRYHWPYGHKEVVVHPEPLGLVGNVFFCGGLSEKYGAIILLEDDLIVSVRFYDYARQALRFYGDDPRIAGISLNALWFNGFTLQPFIPLLDDGDVFFLKLSTPQGQAYTAEQWASFAGWMAGNDLQVTPADDVQDLFAAFPPDDWLSIKAKYLGVTDKYYVYPRESMTTNFGEPGTHFHRATAFFQVPLQHHRAVFRFQSFDAAHAVYDGYFELLPERLNRLTDRFAGLSFDVDLYATKAARHLRADYLLTTRPARDPLLTFGKTLWPMEANAIAGCPGSGIVFAPRANVDLSRRAGIAARRDNRFYFTRRQPPNHGWRGTLAGRVNRALGRRP
jgi:hypothetical protein